MKVRLIVLFISVLKFQLAITQPIVISDTINSVFISNGIEYFIDSANTVKADQLNALNLFHSKSNKTPVLNGVTNVWLKFEVLNKSTTSIYLDLSYPNLSRVTLYKYSDERIISLGERGNSIKIKTALPGSPDIVFNLDLHQNMQAKYFIHIQSVHPIILPMYVSTSYALINSSSSKNLFIGFYFGLLVVIFLYNFFLFISTRDKIYFLYISYIFCLILAQLAACGYGYFYLWPTKPEWNKLMIIWTSMLSGMTALIFSISFLQIRTYARKAYPVLLLILFVYVIGLIASLFHFYAFSYSILNYNSLINGLIALGICIYITAKGYRPAIFYLIAWTAFLVSVFILVFRNLAIFPYNNFTSSALYIGSSLEVTLLSIALADRINILKREKEISQAEALQRAEENEQLVKDQNVVLEQKVGQRTHELKETNLQLNDALDNLKDAQTQLVEAEKMASLGQLTAGIAHEINNPINFVKSNINPLRLDVRDLVDVLNEYEHLHNIKEETSYRKKLSDIEKFKNQIDVKFVQNEIDSLIVGIEEGAQRTAEIVQGLRTFSRIDESELKTVDIHDGILSTLVILKNSTPFYVEIEKQFNARGNVECFPGKLNQVFMNIITNAVQAIKAKTERREKEMITILTRDIENDCIQISVKDTGIGMSEETKHRVFEPFFTTKDVGEGTGLGMAIVFKIIQKHEGKIDIISKPFEGSEFIVTLPYIHPISDHL